MGDNSFICALYEGVYILKSNGQFTQRAELAIENARTAAGSLGHSYVGTEHLLLGIAMESEGLGARILEKHGIGEKELRLAITDLFGTGTQSIPVRDSLPERALQWRRPPQRRIISGRAI